MPAPRLWLGRHLGASVRNHTHLNRVLQPSWQGQLYPMKHRLLAPAILLAACLQLAAQENPVQDRPSQDNPAQDASPPTPRYDFRYSLAVIDDATFYSNLTPSLPPPANQLVNDPSVTLFQNQLLVEPSFTLHYRSRWSIASSVVGLAETFRGLSAADFDIPPGNTAAAAALDAALKPYTGTRTKLRVKETYAGLSAGDFDFMLGRRIVRWGTGYEIGRAHV